MTERALCNLFPNTYPRRDNIRNDWLKSYSQGWSISVCCAHAKCGERAFRVIFADDEEIQKIISENLKNKNDKKKGL